MVFAFGQTTKYDNFFIVAFGLFGCFCACWWQPVVVVVVPLFLFMTEIVQDAKLYRFTSWHNCRLAEQKLIILTSLFGVRWRCSSACALFGTPSFAFWSTKKEGLGGLGCLFWYRTAAQCTCMRYVLSCFFYTPTRHTLTLTLHMTKATFLAMLYALSSYVSTDVLYVPYDNGSITNQFPFSRATQFYMWKTHVDSSVVPDSKSIPLKKTLHGFWFVLVVTITKSWIDFVIAIKAIKIVTISRWSTTYLVFFFLTSIQDQTWEIPKCLSLMKR